MGGRDVHTGFWWGKSEGRIPLGRPRRKWENNIKMDLGEAEWGYELARYVSGQGQVAGCCEYDNEP